MTPELHIFKLRDDVGPGWLFDVLRDGPAPFRVVTIRSPEDFPVAIACTGVIVVGRSLANMDPGDRGAPWKASVDFARTTIGICVTYLGIGDGALLLARAMLGKVSGTLTTGIGFCEVPLLEAGRADPLFSGRESFPAALWPGRSVVLPERTTLLAGTDQEPLAFRFLDAAWGLLAHPEVTPEAFGDWLDEPEATGRPAAPRVDRGALLAELERHREGQREAACTMMRRFVARTRSFCHYVPPEIDESHSCR